MRFILFGILALLALNVVSALGAQLFVPPHSAGLGLQVILPAAYAQGGGKSQGNVPQAPVRHRGNRLGMCKVFKKGARPIRR